jgi:hypothetical protein
VTWQPWTSRSGFGPVRLIWCLVVVSFSAPTMSVAQARHLDSVFQHAYSIGYRVEIIASFYSQRYGTIPSEQRNIGTGFVSGDPYQILSASNYGVVLDSGLMEDRSIKFTVDTIRKIISRFTVRQGQVPPYAMASADVVFNSFPYKLDGNGHLTAKWEGTMEGINSISYVEMYNLYSGRFDSLIYAAVAINAAPEDWLLHVQPAEPQDYDLKISNASYPRNFIAEFPTFYEPRRLEVFDIMGRKVYSIVIQPGETSRQFHLLESGLHVLTIGSARKRFIVY